MDSRHIKPTAWIVLLGGLAFGALIWVQALNPAKQPPSLLTEAELASLKKKAEPPKSESDYRKELATHEARLGSDHVQVGDDLWNLAQLLKSQLKFLEAEPLARRALAIHESKLGRDSLKVGDDLSTLATIVRGQGKFPEALTLSRQALAIHEVKLGKDDSKTGEDLGTLANALQYQGKYPEAEPFFRRRLKILEGNPNKTHFNADIGYALSNLATNLFQQGKNDEAETHATQAQLLLAFNQGPALAETLVLMGKLQNARGKHAEAEESTREAMRIYVARLGNDHIQVAECLSLLGVCLDMQGKFVEAEKSLRSALEIHEPKLGKEDFRVGDDLLFLALSLHGQGRTEAANTNYRRSLAIHLRIHKQTGVANDSERAGRLYYSELLKGNGYKEEQIAAEIREMEKSAGF